MAFPIFSFHIPIKQTMNDSERVKKKKPNLHLSIMAKDEWKQKTLNPEKRKRKINRKEGASTIQEV